MLFSLPTQQSRHYILDLSYPCILSHLLEGHVKGPQAFSAPPNIYPAHLRAQELVEEEVR